MAKQSGLGFNFYVGGFNLSGDIGSLSKIGAPQQTIDMTGIDKLAHERVGTVRDGEIDFTAYFNPSSGQAHPVLSALPTSDVVATLACGTTLGQAACCAVAKQINYDPKRGTNGSLTFDTALRANGFGLDWGVQLTAGQRTDTTATNGTAVDQTVVSTAFGWQAYLQVFSVVGTSVTVTLQDSADNLSFAGLTGGAFNAVASPGPGTQRLAGGATDTVRRYVRAITSGTFTSAVFSVVFVRNQTAVAF